MAISIGGFLAPLIVNFVVGSGNPSLYQYGFLIAGVYIVCGVIGFTLLKDRYLYSHDGKKLELLHFPNRKIYLKMQVQLMLV